MKKPKLLIFVEYTLQQLPCLLSMQLLFFLQYERISTFRIALGNLQLVFILSTSTSLFLCLERLWFYIKMFSMDSYCTKHFK